MTDFGAKDILGARPLPRSFFLRDATTVARDLLGKALVRVHRGKVLGGEIVETEAYLGSADPASHAYRGLTPRTRAMFEEGGIAYVYLSYGVNFCMNVVTGPAGEAQAVLLRALRPLFGVEAMAKNRGLDPDLGEKVLRNVASGPGKLTKAIGVNLSHDGAPFSAGELRLVDLGLGYPARQIVAGPRIGITKAKDLPLRFTVKGSPWVSR